MFRGEKTTGAWSFRCSDLNIWFALGRGGRFGDCMILLASQSQEPYKSQFGVGVLQSPPWHWSIRLSLIAKGGYRTWYAVSLEALSVCWEYLQGGVILFI